MRLTLRTLLAYLDDTLGPAEIKRIGQKVAESDAAQELIARIKQITRRRRLTTPPATGPGARFDPNTIAEYLDNVLPADQVAEFEKTCLESDLYLAEVASCHQILTLVLGEPALVPPTAKERMYGLVQGREAIPFRKAAAPAAAITTTPDGAHADADDMFLLGLPSYRRGTRLRWALPLAGLFLLVALGVALWLAIPRDSTPFAGLRGGARSPDVGARSPDRAPAAPPDATPERKAENKAENKTTGEGAKAGKGRKADSGTSPAAKTRGGAGEPSGSTAKTPDTGEAPRERPGASSTPAAPRAQRPAAPSTERVAAGNYQAVSTSNPTVLVQRPRSSEPWRRLAPGAQVYTNDPLVSLPGYMSELRLDSGVRVLLRGSLPEFVADPFMELLLESAVVLHKSADLDADLTLDRGRIYLSSHKPSGAAHVRLRFAREVWDLTLEEPDTEVAAEIVREYPIDRDYTNEDPLTTFNLCVLRGKAGLKYDTYHYRSLEAQPGPVEMWWNSDTGTTGPNPRKEEPAHWKKTPPATEGAEKVSQALEGLSKRMVGDKALDVALIEARQSDRDLIRRLAIYSLCAIEDIPELIQVLGDEDHTHVVDRQVAIFCLRHWLNQGSDNNRKLYDPKTRTGLLLEGKKYSTGQAGLILGLLHYFKSSDIRDPKTFEALADYLTNSRVAIAELGYWHLVRMSAPVPIPGFFNAAIPVAEREKVADKVRKMIADGELPPPAPKQPAAGAAPESGTGARPMPK